jgi:hypothetical protein
MWGVYPLAMSGNVDADHSDFNLVVCISTESLTDTEVSQFNSNVYNINFPITNYALCTIHQGLTILPFW